MKNTGMKPKRVRNDYNGITLENQKFLAELIKGASHVEAYRKVYPKAANWDYHRVMTQAYKVLKKPKVATQYAKMRQEVQSKIINDVTWSREQSIRELKDVILRNRQELDRIEQASEEELTLIYQQAIQNPEKAEQILLTAIQKRKNHRISKVNNAGIISSVEALNKMCGYNEQTVNYNGQIVFTGEDELED